MKSLAIALALIASGGGGVALHRSAEVEYAIPKELHHLSFMGGVPTAVADELANYVYWATPGQRVVVRLQERDPSSGTWNRPQYVYATSYHVLDVAFRLGGKELYVSGTRVEGAGYTDVIEKWVFPTPDGSPMITIAGGATPIGVARAPLAGSVSIAGGAYVAPEKRISTLQPVPERTLLYEARNGGHFNSVVADPEGRFLFLHNYTSGDVLSLDLSATDRALQTAFAASANPVLSAARTMQMHDVPGVGRICRLTAEDRYGGYPRGTTQTTVLVDAQNDGIFEAFTIHTSIDIARGLTPYGASIDWTGVVNFGWDWKADFK